MTMSSTRHPFTRDQVLLAYANSQIIRSSTKTPAFALSLSRALYGKCPEKAIEKNVPDFESEALKNDTEAYLSASAAWLRRVQRWVDGSTELPAWVEEAWVNALEPEYRDRCINELAARYDLSGARMPQADFCPVSAFGRMVKHLGGAVEACSNVLADGEVNEKDRGELPDAIHHLRGVIARSSELLSRMEQAALVIGLDVHETGRPVH
ncbi:MULTISPECIES: hypothetical protein [Pseudomonas]|uniref:hypothetical protein n=1 Tax=Pseudomonas nitroreducens TaxID=46680 RepID=UPI001E4EFBA6|nr:MULTISPECIES: hypothetical protein [Pseudomonas]MCE4073522.1 hypothetical protein [Pseudomonas nitritireducens]MCE4079761.1 hypothetical protein [Pseudomonas nitroreducens]